MSDSLSWEEPLHAAPATVAIPGYLVGIWKADPVHSEVAFSVRHLMVSKVRGRFTGYDVTIVTSEDPLGSSVTVPRRSTSRPSTPATSGVTTTSAPPTTSRSRSTPTMSYRSTGIRRTGDGWVIDGELTLHGVTRPVPLAVEVNGFGPDPFGGQRAGFSVTAQINRRDFGIDTVPMDGGGVVVGDKVSIGLEIQAVLQT